MDNLLSIITFMPLVAAAMRVWCRGGATCAPLRASKITVPQFGH